jgi:hypothetical protein
MWYLSVIAGDKTANVCARTFTSPSVVTIFGMWHATHWLPVEPFFLGWVCCSRVAVRGRWERAAHGNRGKAARPAYAAGHSSRFRAHRGKGTRNATAIHQALHKIVALHPVLVRGAVRKMGECGLSKRVLLERPEIAKMRAHTIPNRPIVVFAFHGIVNRGPLRMALDARVIGIDIVHLCRIDDMPHVGCAACSLPGPWQRSQPTFHSATCLVRMS